LGVLHVRTHILTLSVFRGVVIALYLSAGVLGFCEV
jgi:uncharacterized protein (UPF0262 family)